VASRVTVDPAALAPEAGLYRFIHRSNANPDGTLNSGAFSLRRDPAVSVGLAATIPQQSFEAFCMLKPDQGVAEILVAHAVEQGLTITPELEPEWKHFAASHGVLGGYGSWSNKKRDAIARKLRDIANERVLRKVPSSSATSP
jgi:hypothetical protein